MGISVTEGVIAAVFVIMAFVAGLLTAWWIKNPPK